MTTNVVIMTRNRETETSIQDYLSTMDASPETTSPPRSSSPILQVSPFSNFLSSLTPINDLTTETYSQRLLGALLPTPPVVFTSPRIDIEREINFFDRKYTVEAGSNVDFLKRRNSTVFKSGGYDNEVQFGDASGSIKEYIVDPALKVDGTNSADKLSTISASKASETDVHEDIDGSTKSEAFATLNQADEDIELPSLKQINAPVIERTNNDSVSLVTQSQSLDHLNIAKEVSQYQRCIRRHLQFGSAVPQTNSSFPCYDSLRSTHAANVRSVSERTYLKTLCSHSDNKAFTSPQGVPCDASQLSCLYESIRSGQFGGNSSTFPSMNSGIGLHLNSITQSTSMSSDVFSGRKSIGRLNTPDHMLEHHNMEHESCNSFNSAVAQQNYSCMVNEQQGSQTAAQSTFSYYSANRIPYLPSDPTDNMVVDQNSVSFKEMNDSEDANKIVESNQLSQKKKSKRGADMSDGCKRCNCKKSKCLKLYCECFAAGVFCLDSCSCENCYNKPEFEDTVFDARQQIESRNPLAFAPRVVMHEFNSLPKIMEEADRTTPSSARHKRGCNCKKSKCLKKYCECYQANVGCSAACRCDGCQNPCGTITDQENNRAANSVKSGNECAKATNMDPYSPLQKLSVSSASASMRNCTKKSQGQLQSSRLPPSGTSQLKRGRSPVIFTPQVSDSKGPYQVSSGGISYVRKDNEIPECLKESPIPSKVITGSPNKKRVLSPQTRDEKLWSRSPKGLKSGRKFLLQAMPSFPPLSPYSDS